MATRSKSDLFCILNFAVYRKMVSFILKKLRGRKDIFLFLGFLGLGAFYFFSKYLPLKYHIIHLTVDDIIPFLPIFIIPYIIWYLYVPLPMIYLFFKDSKAFKRQAIIFFSGSVFCSLFFVIYPTAIDFRPTAEGKGILLWLTRFIYSNDTPPAYVFPSLHCYEALTIHFTTFTAGPLKNRKILRIASAVLVAFICASTVFVKQHSFIDVIGGCVISIVFCLIGNRILRGKRI